MMRKLVGVWVIPLGSFVLAIVLALLAGPTFRAAALRPPLVETPPEEDCKAPTIPLTKVGEFNFEDETAGKTFTLKTEVKSNGPDIEIIFSSKELPGGAFVEVDSFDLPLAQATFKMPEGDEACLCVTCWYPQPPDPGKKNKKAALPQFNIPLGNDLIFCVGTPICVFLESIIDKETCEPCCENPAVIQMVKNVVKPQGGLPEVRHSTFRVDLTDADQLNSDDYPNAPGTPNTPISRNVKVGSGVLFCDTPGLIFPSSRVKAVRPLRKTSELKTWVVCEDPFQVFGHFEWSYTLIITQNPATRKMSCETTERSKKKLKAWPEGQGTYTKTIKDFFKRPKGARRPTEDADRFLPPPGK